MKKILASGAALALAQFASGAVTIDVLEVGADVKATLSGGLNKDALLNFISNSGGFNGYLPTSGNISFTTTNSEYFAISVNTWTPFGTGGFGNWTTSNGDAFHMFSNPVLGLPIGYVSNAALNASATKSNATFASLGFTPGSYVTTLVGAQGVVDTVTVNIGIPAPGAFALLGLAGLGAARRRR